MAHFLFIYILCIPFALSGMRRSCDRQRHALVKQAVDEFLCDGGDPHINQELLRLKGLLLKRAVNDECKQPGSVLEFETLHQKKLQKKWDAARNNIFAMKVIQHMLDGKTFANPELHELAHQLYVKFGKKYKALNRSHEEFESFLFTPEESITDETLFGCNQVTTYILGVITSIFFYQVFQLLG